MLKTKRVVTRVDDRLFDLINASNGENISDKCRNLIMKALNIQPNYTYKKGDIMKTTTEERIKLLVNTYFSKKSKWKRVYVLKQGITSICGYCYVQELAQWFQDMGYETKLDGNNRWWVKAQSNRTYTQNFREIRDDWHERYPNWEAHRDIPEDDGTL